MGIPLGAVSVWVVFSAVLRSLEDALGLDYQHWEVVSLSTTMETLIMPHLPQRVCVDLRLRLAEQGGVDPPLEVLRPTRPGHVTLRPYRAPVTRQTDP
jgi:hypothetical protein